MDDIRQSLAAAAKKTVGFDQAESLESDACIVRLQDGAESCQEAVMHLREILWFRRQRDDVVPMDVLRSLGLPTPDDVLEQFISDHGTKDEFQQQYGHLDLHAVRWQQLLLPASEILACSIYRLFAQHVATVSNQTRVVPEEGWADVCLPSKAAEHWQQHGTWMRSPVMVRGELVGSAKPLHLVEGHTRIGALRGLVDSGVLPMASDHRVWVGEAFQPEAPDERWREVLRTKRMPFLDWLMGRVGDDGEIGNIASRLIDVQHSSLSFVRIEGDDLDAVLSFARTDAVLKPLISTIVQAHAEWERFVGG